MNKRDSPKHLVPLTPKTNRQRSKPSWIKCWQNWRKNRISIFSCQVFCSQFWHCLWTWSISGQNWSGKFNKFFLLPSRFCVLIWHLGNHFTPPFLKIKPQRVRLCQNKQSWYYIIVKYYLLNGLSANHPTFLFECFGIWITALLIVSFIDPN